MRKFNTLTQFQSQVLCPEVCIPLQHSQVLVSRDGSHLHHIKPILKEPSGGFMSQVMKPEINDVIPAESSAPCTFQRLKVQGEDRLMTPDIPRQVSQQLQRQR